MPYVSIRVSKDAFTRRQKEEVIRSVTQLLADVLGTGPGHTLVFIDEMETDNVGFGSESITTLLERKVQDDR